MHKLRNIVSLIFIAFIALLAVPLARFYFASAFLTGVTFHSSIEWFHPLYLLYWSFYIFVFAALGFLLALLVRSHHSFWWVFSLGAFYSIFLIGFSRNYFSQNADFVTYFWAYGEQLMPVVGTMLGHLLHKLLFRSKLAPNYAIKGTSA